MLIQEKSSIQDSTNTYADCLYYQGPKHIYLYMTKIKNEELDLLDQVVISPQLAELSTKPELSMSHW